MSRRKREDRLFLACLAFIAAVVLMLGVSSCGDPDAATRITPGDLERARQEAHGDESDPIGGGYGNAGR